MEANSNLDSNLLTTLESLKGKCVNFFAGLNLNIYQKDNIVNYQFHSGIYLSTYILPQDTKSFFLNGRMIEDENGRDRFYLETTTKSIETESLADYSVLYPRFSHKKQTLSHRIIDVIPYFLNSKTVDDVFGVHFKCEHDKDFMIRFQFPADGLHLSIGKKEITSFFESDSFGKKLKPYSRDNL